MFRPVLVALASLCLLLPVPALSLDRLAGRLLELDLAFVLPGEPVRGHFDLAAETPGGEVALAPGRLAIQTFRGRIEASARAVYGPASRDPLTGRPRRLGAEGPCTGNVFGGLTRPDPRDVDYSDGRDLVPNGIPAGGVPPETACLTPANVASDLSVSLGLFTQICARSIGLTDLDPEACAATIYGSPRSPLSGGLVDPDAPAGTLAALFANLAAGNPTAGFLGDALAAGIQGQLVALGGDPCDGLLADCATPADGVGQINDPSFFGTAFPSLNGVLTQQQKALLGCGEFYGTNCEIDGIDLLHAEFSALVQSWPVPGSPARMDDTSQPQPGTVGFTPVRGRVATRPLAGGASAVLPGARGSGDGAYDPRIDGCHGLSPLAADCASAIPLLQPLSGQPFASELAALSWNLLMLTTALSFAGDDDGDGVVEIDPDEFDPANPLRIDGCSFVRPGGCAAVIGFASLGSLPLDDDPRGSNPRWVWENGAEFEIDSASGAHAALLGERVYSIGPEVSRLDFAGLQSAAKGLAFAVGTLPPAALAHYAEPTACGNGEDDDDDGLVDLEDPGCPLPFAYPENPLCDDGLDNDDNGLTDFDDPVCRPEFPYTEFPACGLGAELAFALLPLAWLRRRREKSRAR